jgi:hypothetical protein
MTSGDPVIGLGDALALVFGAIRVARRGLLCNPSVEQERELTARLNGLELERAAIQARLDAAIAGSAAVDGPTPGQVAEIGRLTSQVDTLTSSAATASAAIVFTSRVLAVVTEIAGGG